MSYSKTYEQLNSIYLRNRSDIVICYGTSRCGLNKSIESFIRGKDYLYYKASDVEPNLQSEIFANQVYNQLKLPKALKLDYQNVLNAYLNDDTNSKKIIIIDDFTYLLKGSNTYINYICNLISDVKSLSGLMIILCTNDIYFVENELMNIMGDKSYEISAIIKDEPLKLDELIASNSHLNPKEVFIFYTCIGGNCLLWDNVKNIDDIKSFIIEDYLNEDKIYYKEGLNILPSRLRQKSLYNTILYYLAGGHNKLNDLHLQTGIDRAKLSVYLKTLIAHDLVTKVEYENFGNTSNIAKAVYMITDPFVDFWYHFIYPNITSFSVLGPERFYKKVISPKLIGYYQKYYSHYCKYIIRTNKHFNMFYGKIIDILDYQDKDGLISFIAKLDKNNSYACVCNLSIPHLSYKDYEKVLDVIKQIEKKNVGIILFSDGGFDQKLRLSAHVSDKIILYDEKEGFIKN